MPLWMPRCISFLWITVWRFYSFDMEIRSKGFTVCGVPGAHRPNDFHDFSEYFVLEVNLLTYMSALFEFICILSLGISINEHIECSRYI